MGDLLWAFTMFTCPHKTVTQEGKRFRCVNCKRRLDELPITKPRPTKPEVIEFRKAS